jgi:hypothetical protein
MLRSSKEKRKMLEIKMSGATEGGVKSLKGKNKYTSFYKRH